MWVARNKNNELYLWLIRPERYKTRLSKCSEEFKKNEEELKKELGKFYDSEYWTYTYEFTKYLFGHDLDYIDGVKSAELDAIYRLHIDDEMFPEVTWEDDPKEVDLIYKK